MPTDAPPMFIVYERKGAWHAEASMPYRRGSRSRKAAVQACHDFVRMFEQDARDQIAAYLEYMIRRTDVAIHEIPSLVRSDAWRGWTQHPTQGEEK